MLLNPLDICFLIQDCDHWSVRDGLSLDSGLTHKMQVEKLQYPKIGNSKNGNCFFHQRHALSMSFYIFVVTYRVTNFLPKLIDMLLFSTEKTEFLFFVFPICLSGHGCQRPEPAPTASADPKSLTQKQVGQWPLALPRWTTSGHVGFWMRKERGKTAPHVDHSLICLLYLKFACSCILTFTFISLGTLVELSERYLYLRF